MAGALALLLHASCVLLAIDADAMLRSCMTKAALRRALEPSETCWPRAASLGAAAAACAAGAICTLLQVCGVVGGLHGARAGLLFAVGVGACLLAIGGGHLATQRARRRALSL